MNDDDVETKISTKEEDAMSDGDSMQKRISEDAEHESPVASIVPVEAPRTAFLDLVRSFVFKGDRLDIHVDGEDVFIGVRSVVDALGVSYQGQIEKLKDDPSLCLKRILTQLPDDDQRRSVSFLAVRHLPLWLASIHPSKVKPEARPKLIAYKREAADVIADHYLGKRGAPGRLVAPGLRTETILVTPEMATEWLTHRNEQNRPLRLRLVERYAADIRGGRWKTTHQGIAFGPRGELIDGQHRLKAIEVAGIAVELYVTHYESAEAAADAKLKCDTGRTKSLGDVFAMVGLTGRCEGDRVAAIVKAMCIIDGHSTDSMSADAVRAFYLADQEAIDWSLATLSGNDFTALHRAAFAYAYSAFPEQIERFALAIKNVDAPAGSPASSYLKASLRTSGGAKERRELMLKILRLLRAHVAGEKGLSKLYVSTESVEFFRARREARKALGMKDGVSAGATEAA